MGLWKILLKIIILGLELSSGEVMVTLPEGLARGITEFSEKGKAFYSFTGIPYAKSPTGARRFKPPEPLEAWGQARGGQIIECAQEETGREEVISWGKAKVRGVEDCLVINIYTPNVSREVTSRYPVMVFVHGGGYFAGSGAPSLYGPEYLMDHDVILITVNYRLGPLGFLSLGDSIVPGNLGMWDLAMATSFIHGRVDRFGGDPSRITMFGQSAGSMAVQLLMMSSRMTGMFSAAILQSGPILSAFSHSDKHPAYYGRTFAGAVGCPPEANTSVILNCLQAKDLEDIVTNVRLFDHEDDVLRNAPNPWKPIYDGYFLPPEEAFLTADPLDLLEAANFSDIPVMVGHTKDEGLYAVTEMISRSSDAIDIVMEDWPNKKGPSYILGREEDEIDSVDSEIAREFYAQFLDSGNSRDPLVLQNWFSPSVWTAATLRTSELLAEGKSSPTFLYHYTHPGAISLSDMLSYPLWKLILKVLGSLVNLDLFPNSLSGATHFDEIFLLFKVRNFPFLQMHSPEDKAVSDNLLKLWTNFAKTYDPVIDDTGKNMVVQTQTKTQDDNKNDDNNKNDDSRENVNVIWEKLKSDKPQYLEIGTDELSMKNIETFERFTIFGQKCGKRFLRRCICGDHPLGGTPRVMLGCRKNNKTGNFKFRLYKKERNSAL